MRMMRSLLRAAQLALTFLTTLPLPQLRSVQPDEFRRASSFYPLAGYVVGAFVALTLWGAQGLGLPAGVGAALALAVWLGVTGMLHFDGLVDCGDALLVMKSPARRLEILRDVHVGAFGLATGVTALLLKWSLLAAVSGPLYVVVAAVVARLVVLAPMHFFPAARPGSLGASARQGWWPLALVLTLPVLLLPQAWLGLLAALAMAVLVGRFAAARLGGGLNGDAYGAVIETAEIAALLALVASRA
ncbi:adenosylcobinamide-GDP ribazoletransferase [Deinococcus peraridilitoris]|uniref:Adenosylcobinamide-GDP ribazoletransferase n=1 Tax=Deinococcus peraridilitoris (strain DSM 19664 / LMG 22246 / CIP 109416 / KR-200) TaxID=937777 RepID=K9ZX23_DEIPD|nr:adenosylcobinamide-GDP ribazoletransferase [Deinococcus peraridilitoris]AFZ66193.1 cobalamin-5-phosphate synthase [Deinococcus peraridilitoris DSM 19664]